MCNIICLNSEYRKESQTELSWPAQSAERRAERMRTKHLKKERTKQSENESLGLL
jgi:hypothetical protein